MTRAERTCQQKNVSQRRDKNPVLFLRLLYRVVVTCKTDKQWFKQIREALFRVSRYPIHKRAGNVTSVETVLLIVYKTKTMLNRKQKYTKSFCRGL